MGFWENVDSELKFQNKTRKQLSQALSFDPTTISKGISNGSIPLADMALKIADFLNVSLEYLLDMPEKTVLPDCVEIQKQIHLYRKYHDLIEQAERLNENQVKAIENLMQTM
ncbi:MAG: helix-turn-helix transcriptional regulator [Treponema sp.]|nr:helix-turn-helix transcriptional regulator [Treponema sp.]